MVSHLQESETMNIDCVTITGADDSIAPSDLVRLSRRFPFVEWGLLLSKSQAGRPRFPSSRWLHELQTVRTPDMQFSGHVCGTWVRDMLSGGCLLHTDMFPALSLFRRLQWNFHAERHATNPVQTAKGLNHYLGVQHIFQMDGVNDGRLLASLKFNHIEPNDIVPLFDTSGGAGIIPTHWPPVWPGVYCGYAGGLGPDTLAHELIRIDHVAGQATIWIDMERRVRSDDDQQFVLAKVEHCLQIASGSVTI